MEVRSFVSRDTRWPVVSRVRRAKSELIRWAKAAFCMSVVMRMTMLGRRHLVQIEEDAARGRDQHDGGQHPRQHAAVRLHQRIEGVLDDERVAAGRGRQARREDEGQGDLAPARPDPVGDKAPQRALRPLVEDERGKPGAVIWSVCPRSPRRRLPTS